MTRLHINIDHVATLRNQRDCGYPSPLKAAHICMDAGADGITVHLREDRRHIRDDDVRALRAAQLGLLNLEMAVTSEMTEIAASVMPDVVTLVPERRQERTTEGGLDVLSAEPEILQMSRFFRGRGIKLSLFVEADEAQIRASHRVGAQQVELHTGHYSEASREKRGGVLRKIEVAAQLAASLGMEVAAGHGLNQENVGDLAAVTQIEELNIGHSVISDAVFVGLAEAVRQLRASILRARG